MAIWLFICTHLYAFTPVIDANKWEDWENVDLHNSTGSYNLPYDACKKLWITHDDTCIYIGWEFGGDPWNDGKSAHWMFAIDVNGTSEGNGTDPWCSTTQVGWTNKPDFWITAWIPYGNDAFGGIDLRKWDGTQWKVVGGLRHAESVSGGWAEISISRDTLGVSFGDSIYIICYFRPAENKPGISDANPYDDTCSDYADNSAYITQGFWYHIKDTSKGPLIDGYIYIAKHDWSRADSICSNSNGGSGSFAWDSLYSLFVTWDTQNLYIGVDAHLTTDHANYCLIYIDVDFQQFDSLGWNDRKDLADETGALDAAITGDKPSICPVKGFYADFVLGAKNAGDCNDNTCDTVGLRRLDTSPNMDNFWWINCKVRATPGGDLEAEIPWRNLYPDATEIVPINAKIALFVLIKDATGNGISNATLPEEVFPSTMNSAVSITIDRNGDGIPDIPPDVRNNSKVITRTAGDSSTYDVPEIDGTIFFVSDDDWKKGEFPLLNSITSNWSGDTLDSLFITWDLHDLYIGIKGALTTTNGNALLIYIDKDFGKDKNDSGFVDSSDVKDNTGVLDNAISGSVPETVKVKGFMADYVVGCVNAHDCGYYGLEDSAGLRKIENPTDFAWISKCDLQATPGGDVEIKINWNSIYGKGNGKVDTGAVLALFAIIKNWDGNLTSNQCLPSDNTPSKIDAVFYICIDRDSNGIPDTGVTAYIGDYVWYGGVSDEWEVSSNWNMGKCPDENADVIIPPHRSRYPAVRSKTINKCKNLYIQTKKCTLFINSDTGFFFYGNVLLNDGCIQTYGATDTFRFIAQSCTLKGTGIYVGGGEFRVHSNYFVIDENCSLKIGNLKATSFVFVNPVKLINNGNIVATIIDREITDADLLFKSKGKIYGNGKFKDLSARLSGDSLILFRDVNFDLLTIDQINKYLVLNSHNLKVNVLRLNGKLNFSSPSTLFVAESIRVGGRALLSLSDGAVIKLNGKINLVSSLSKITAYGTEPPLIRGIDENNLCKLELIKGDIDITHLNLDFLDSVAIFIDSLVNIINFNNVYFGKIKNKGIYLKIRIKTNFKDTFDCLTFADTVCSINVYLIGSAVGLAKALGDTLWITNYGGAKAGEDYDKEENGFVIWGNAGNLKWVFPKPFDKYIGNINCSPTKYGNICYIGDEDGKLYAIKILDGDTNWTFQATGPIRGTPTVFDSVIFFGTYSTPAKIYAVKDNGKSYEVLWTYDVNSAIVGAVICDGEKVYFGTADGEIYALNKEDGTPAWTTPYSTNGSICSSPAICNLTDELYIGSDVDTIFKIQTFDGTWLGAVYAEGDVKAPPWIEYFPQSAGDYVPKRIYVGSYGGKFFAMKPINFDTVWTYSVSAPIHSLCWQDFLDSYYIYFLDTSGKLWVIDTLKNPNPYSWTNYPLDIGSPAYSAPVIWGNYIYFGADNGIFYAVNKQTGEIVWKYNTGAKIRSYPVVSVDNNVVIIGSYNGKVYCFYLSQ